MIVWDLQNKLATSGEDDRLTYIGIAALAYVVQDLVHEALGHGGAAWLSGAHRILLSTIGEQSEFTTRWIAASGTLMNLSCAVIFWFILRKTRGLKPATRYFFVVGLATSLFTGTGYFFFSGVTDFGDWAEVIAGQQPHWLWRVGLIAIGVVTYYASLLLVGIEFMSFSDSGEDRRVRRLSWTAYFSQGGLAFLAGLLNPAGLFYVVASALPSTLGANAGMLFIDRVTRTSRHVADPVRRSVPWIVAAAIVCSWFIFILGRRISWSR